MFFAYGERKYYRCAKDGICMADVADGAECPNCKQLVEGVEDVGQVVPRAEIVTLVTCADGRTFRWKF